MIWVVEKKVIHHVLDYGFGSLDIPVRVKFEFEVNQGSFVPGSLSFETLYNKAFLARRYPNLNLALLEGSIVRTVRKEICRHLKECGFLPLDSTSEFLSKNHETDPALRNERDETK